MNINELYLGSGDAVEEGDMKIRTANRHAFEQEIARLNKRASKIGVSPIAFTFLGTVDTVRTVITVFEGEESSRRVPVTVAEYELSLPAFEDYRWQLVATLTPVEGNGTFVDAHVAGFDIAAWQNVDPCRCQHCNTNRTRSLTYVVENKDDRRQLQVGRSCFADYVGHDGLLKLEFQAVLVSMFNDSEGFFPNGGPRGVPVVEVRRAIAMAELLAEQNGWKYNVKDEDGRIVEDGTHRQAARFVNGLDSGLGLYAALKNSDNPVWAKVDGIIEWVRNIDAGDDEFARTLQYCLQFDMVPDKKAGLVAYAGQFMRNYIRKQQEAARKATAKHVGTVGERRMFTLKCTRVTRFEGEFGVTYFNNFEDAEGNLILWKTGTFAGEEGKEYTMKATVKAHSEWRGGKQTEISRAKIS